MNKRVGMISVIVENRNSVPLLNQILSECSEYIIGRMGIPYPEKNISIICIAVDAPEDLINSMSGKLGKLDGISAKVNYSRVNTEADNGTE